MSDESWKFFRYTAMHAVPGGTQHPTAPIHAVPGSMQPPAAPMHAVPGGTLHLPAPTQAVPGATLHTPAPMQAVPGGTLHAPAHLQAVPGGTLHHPASTQAVPGGTLHTPAHMQAVPGGTLYPPAHAQDLGHMAAAPILQPPPVQGMSSGYNMIVDMRPLDAQVDPKIKAKTWQDEYINLVSLIQPVRQSSSHGSKPLTLDEDGHIRPLWGTQNYHRF